jgi:hypothetical protein
VEAQALVDRLKAQAKTIFENNETTQGQGATDKLGATIDELIAHITDARNGYSRRLGQIKTQLMAAAGNQDKAEIQRQLAALEMQIRSAYDRDGSVWTGDGETFFHTLFWGLAGVLAYKLIIIGTYMRYRRFYVEGIVMHLSHILVAPILVLIAVWLLSQVTFRLALSEGSQFTVDLTNAKILYALAFILGSNPWGLWKFVQRHSDTLTRQSPAAGSPEPSRENPA